MKRYAVLILAAGLLVAAAAKDDEISKELKKAEGTYTLKSGEDDGKKMTDDALKGSKLTLEGEKHTVKVGDIAQISDNPKVQKALRRLAADKAPTTLSQLVMWNLSAGLDWNSISQLSQQWANRHELTLAQDFVERLDTLP